MYENKTKEFNGLEKRFMKLKQLVRNFIRNPNKTNLINKLEDYVSD